MPTQMLSSSTQQLEGTFADLGKVGGLKCKKQRLFYMRTLNAEPFEQADASDARFFRRRRPGQGEESETQTCSSP